MLHPMAPCRPVGSCCPYIQQFNIQQCRFEKSLNTVGQQKVAAVHRFSVTLVHLFKDFLNLHC